MHINGSKPENHAWIMDSIKIEKKFHNQRTNKNYTILASYKLSIYNLMSKCQKYLFKKVLFLNLFKTDWFIFFYG